MYAPPTAAIQCCLSVTLPAAPCKRLHSASSTYNSCVLSNLVLPPWQSDRGLLSTMALAVTTVVELTGIHNQTFSLIGLIGYSI